MRRLLGPNVALIGVGGVDSTETALEKIRAGADLVQLYTGMIYAGPTLPGRIVKDLSRFLDKEGLRSLAEIRDSRVDALGGQDALEGGLEPYPQRRIQADAAHIRKTCSAAHRPALPKAGPSDRAPRRRPANDSSIMLRMSRDQVAPMKTPSIWKASTPESAVRAAQGR